MACSIQFPTNNAVLSGSFFLTGVSDSPADYYGLTIDGYERAYAPGWHNAATFSGLFDTATFSQDTHTVFATPYVSTFSSVNPSSLGAILDIDFSDTSTMFIDTTKTHSILNGSGIACITDKTGQQPDFVQATLSQRPVWLQNQQGPYIRNSLLYGSATFSSSAHSLLESITSLNAASGDVFIACSMPTTTGQTMFGAGKTSDGNNWMEFNYQGGVLRLAADFNGSVEITSGTNVLAANQVYVLNFRSLGASYQFFANGIQDTLTGNNTGKWFHTAAGGMVSPNSVTLGGLDFGGSFNYTDGQLFRIIVFPQPLSASDRLRVEGLLAQQSQAPYIVPLPFTAGATSPTVTFSVNNAISLNMPKWFPYPYQHIKLHATLYQGVVNTNNGPPSDPTLLATSFSTCNGGSPAQIRGLDNSQLPMLLYDTLALVEGYQFPDWTSYASGNGLNREDIFIHVTGTAYSLTAHQGGSASFPVRNWWDAFSFRAGISGSLFHKGANSSQFNDGTLVTLGAASGDSIVVGYNDPIDQCNFTISTAGAGGWSGVLEYPSAIDKFGVPTSWSPFTLTQDTTKMLTQTGQMRFFPLPSPAWLFSRPTQSGSLFNPDYLLYPINYLRLRTLKPGSTTPIVSLFTPSDYTGQGSTFNTGSIPVFDTAADLNHDGYLSDAEVTGILHVPNASTMTARFFYQTRMCSNYGTQTWFPNYTSTSFQTWAVDWANRYRNAPAKSGYDGTYFDNSSVAAFSISQIIENQSTFSQDYGKVLGNIWRSNTINSMGRQGFNLQNIGPSYTTDKHFYCSQSPGFHYQGVLADHFNWSEFSTSMDTVHAIQATFSPEPIGAVEAYSPTRLFYNGIGGLPAAQVQRAQQTCMAAYYMVCTSGTYFDFCGDDGTTTDVYPNRWCAALTVNVGAATGPATILASGLDPDPNALDRTYRVYQRQFQNGMVMYKPNSYSATWGSGNIGDVSISNHDLGGSYFPVNNDGSLSSAVNNFSFANAQGQVFLSNNSQPNGNGGTTTLYSSQGAAVIITSPPGLASQIQTVDRAYFEGITPSGILVKYGGRFQKIRVRKVSDQYFVVVPPS